MNFAEYISGKRIAVVGPAGSIHGSKQGEDIDSYDIVVRFNNAIPTPETSKVDIGTKTNILCNCLEEHPTSGGKINPQMWKDNGVEWVLSPYPKECWFAGPNINHFINVNKNLVNLQCVDKPFYDDLETKIKTRPNSGLLGIMYILKHNVKEMYVTGITFGRGGYRPGYKNHISVEQYNKLANSSIHQQKPQEDLFRSVYKKDTRITADSTLSEILGSR